MRKINVLWCVNPFQDERALRESCRSFLAGLKRKAVIEPVYVSSPAELEISLSFNIPIQERYRTVALEKMNGYLREVKGLSLKAPRIIQEKGTGISDAAKALANYARRVGADVIVLGSHARSGLARFMLGSYAESLVAAARTPVVLVKPNSRILPVKKILFATDLSPASRKAFKAAVGFAKVAGASLLLQNVVECPSHWITTRGYILDGPRAVTPAEYVAALEQSRRAAARPFLDLARKSRVSAELRVDARVGQSSDIILKTALKEKVGLIALASQSSRLRAGLLGSVARKIIHGADRSVWLLRSV